MKIFKNIFLFNKQKIENKKHFNQEGVDRYSEIGTLVKDARIQQNLSIEELSRISKIPEQTIYSIENNIRNLRPKYPFIRSILIKLEECLVLKENSLVTLVSKKTKTIKRNKKNFIISKFDLINTWQGTFLYFLILILTIVFLKKYFISNVIIIEIQNTENQIIEK